MMMYISKNVLITICDGYIKLLKCFHPFSSFHTRIILDNIYFLNDFISKISECDGISFLEKD